MFASAQSALEQKKKKIRKATKFTSLKYPSKPCVNKSTENLAERESNTVSGVWLVTYATYGINNKLHCTMHYTHTHNMTCAWCLELPIDDMGAWAPAEIFPEGGKTIDT